DPAHVAAHPCDTGSRACDTLRARAWGGEPLYRRGQTRACLRERAASPGKSHHPATGPGRHNVPGAASAAMAGSDGAQPGLPTAAEAAPTERRTPALRASAVRPAAG